MKTVYRLGARPKPSICCVKLTSGTTGAYVLPSAPRLQAAFGGGVYPVGTISNFNGQVTVGDVFVIPTYVLATSVGVGSVTAGTGAAGTSGTVNIPAYTNPQDMRPLVIQFTSVVSGSESYILQ